ncbi:MAG: thiosulfate oxidation carrier protein SoxY [Pseudomonadales bacterium]
MMVTRRKIMHSIMALVALSTLPFKILARANKAFDAENIDIVFKEIFGDLPIVKSTDIKFKIPDIAENGAVVPVSISTNIPGVEAIYVIVDENPNPLSASFHLGPMSPADISVRVKMGRSSMVRAMVKTRDKVYTTGKEVKVTIGGCGG